MKNCQLAIYIKGKPVKQGKFCIVDGKPYYIANCTPRKWFKNFSGYAIAKQILEALPKGTKIIYKRSDIGQYYQANKTRFYNKGVAGVWGDHSQVVLPVRLWDWKAGKPKEKYGLPTLTVSQWKNPQRAGSGSGQVPGHHLDNVDNNSPVEDCSFDDYIKQRLKLKNLFYKVVGGSCRSDYKSVQIRLPDRQAGQVAING